MESTVTSGPPNGSTPRYSFEALKAKILERYDEYAKKAVAEGWAFCKEHFEKHRPGTKCQVCEVLEKHKK